MRALLWAGVAAVGWVEAAHADLITNGNFSSTFSQGTQSAATPSQLNYNGYGVTGWTSSPGSGYNLVFNPNLAGSAAYTSDTQSGSIQLYTSGNRGSATAPASLVSPAGGNFVAASGAFQPGSLSQVVNNLVIGTDYVLTFYWAASQEAGYDGTTTESFGVTFGNQSFSTPTVTNPSRGFTPWTRVQYTFKASSTSQTLSFLAGGGPSADQRPFTLLDGVSLDGASSAPTPVPEPASLSLLGLGAAGVAASRRRRARRHG